MTEKNKISRRSFIKASSLTVVGSIVLSKGTALASEDDGFFTSTTWGASYAMKCVADAPESLPMTVQDTVTIPTANSGNVQIKITSILDTKCADAPSTPPYNYVAFSGLVEFEFQVLIPGQSPTKHNFYRDYAVSCDGLTGIISALHTIGNSQGMKAEITLGGTSVVIACTLIPAQTNVPIIDNNNTHNVTCYTSIRVVCQYLNNQNQQVELLDKISAVKSEFLSFPVSVSLPLP